MNIEDIVSRLLLDRDRVGVFTGDAVVINTDDNMKLEYSAPLHVHARTSEDNVWALMSKALAREFVPVDAVHGATGRVRLAQAYARQQDWLRALITLRAADQLAPGDAQIEALYAEYQARLADELR